MSTAGTTRTANTRPDTRSQDRAGTGSGRPVGQLLREWRERRRLSQLALAIEADISTRHLSFVETGRSKPTREMILRLTDHLDVPLRERNRLLLAGGYAPAYPQHGLDAPELDAVRGAIRQLLAAHAPNPAVVVDQHWNLVDGNSAVPLFTAGSADELLVPPVNVLRLGLHPRGMAPRIRNLGQWRAHLLHRLRRQEQATGDPVLAELYDELSGYPCEQDADDDLDSSVVVPLRYSVGDRELSLLSTTAVFGTPRDVTVAELAIEAFFPADAATATALRELATD